MHLDVKRLVLPGAVMLGLAGALASCKVIFSDQVHYSCTSDVDCGGDSFVCTPNGVCCKPSGAEVCDSLDNDCDGFADNTGKREECNGEDDDCNGRIDDGFDFKRNANHCGACNRACLSFEYCGDGKCLPRTESSCFDGFDDDGNGKTDCEDPSCDMRSCGTACLCINLKKSEDLCSDGVDNEIDGLTDCADPDCLDKACRAGCACVADGGQVEVDCMDGVDNDLDGQADCLDPDCLGRFCTPPQIYFQCTADKLCRCHGGVQIAEVGSVRCRDGIDNDCDGPLDCAEVTCTGQSCTPDGGPGCECFNGGKKEAACANLVDDDGDGPIDCADSDCVQGTTCQRPDGGGAGLCSSTMSCE